jgi:hypothetical protein
MKYLDKRILITTAITTWLFISLSTNFNNKCQWFGSFQLEIKTQESPTKVSKFEFLIYTVFTNKEGSFWPMLNL